MPRLPTDDDPPVGRRGHVQRLLSRLSAGDGEGSIWWCSAYIVDWGTGIVAILLAKLYFEPMKPYERDITPYLDDPDLRWPHVPDQQVPIDALNNLSITLPVLLSVALVLISYFAHPELGSRRLLFPTLHHTLLALLAAHAISEVPLTLLKAAVGRLRPDFLSRCQPSLEQPYVCTGPAGLVAEGRRSFPSGHSTQSFAGLGYLALWIAGRNGAYAYGGDGQRGTGPLQSRLLRGVWATVWLALAAWVAVTRLEDHMHHPSDVLAGSLLGFASALIAYCIYFPSPFNGFNLTNLGKPRLVYAHRILHEARTWSASETAGADVEAQEGEPSAAAQVKAKARASEQSAAE